MKQGVNLTGWLGLQSIFTLLIYFLPFWGEGELNPYPWPETQLDKQAIPSEDRTCVS